MVSHTVIFGLHNRDDNMTLREEITQKRKEFWREADSTQMGEELELIIDRIDGMDDRISEIESEIVNLNLRMDSIDFVNTGATIKLSAPATSEPFPGYNDLLEEAIPVIKAAIAEKNRELEKKIFVP